MSFATIPVNAIETGQFVPGMTFEWTRVLGWNVSRLGVELVTREDIIAISEMAKHGFDIDTGVFWCWELPNKSIFDLFYNSTCIRKVERMIDRVFEHDPGEDPGLSPDRVSWFKISSEEPFWALHWTENFPWVINDVVAVYNETYKTETGFWLKPFNSMNNTEKVVLHEWSNEKFKWVWDHLYDYLKSKWPNIDVCVEFWAPKTLVPGAVPWIYKSDCLAGYGYLTRDDGNAWYIYEGNRWYKSFAPEKKLQMVLWASDPYPEPECGEGFKAQEKSAWLSYLGGADIVYWFSWHDLLGWSWYREDSIGKRLFLYSDWLNAELMKLPVFKPKPEVLIVPQFLGNAPCEPASEINAYLEYDIMDPRCMTQPEVDLSQYKLIVLSEYRFYDDTVQKLNDYVKSGGNIIFLGGAGWPTNVYDNATRMTPFLMEEDATTTLIKNHILMNITTPNPLGLDLEFDAEVLQTFRLNPANTTGSYHSIGEFSIIDEYGSATPISGYPLILYHNSTNPNEGKVLYCGIQYATSGSSFDWSNRTHAAEINGIYKEIIKSFALNTLRMNGSISDSETENLLITQAMIDDDTLLSGISNYMINSVVQYNGEARDINYTLNLDRFDLSDGDYWVHSLDENASLGLFSSDNGVLRIPIHIDANSTRLLLISKTKPEPDYWVDTSPSIPNEDDLILFKDLFAESASDIENTSLEINSFRLSLVNVGISGLLLILIIEYFTKKRLKFHL